MARVLVYPSLDSPDAVEGICNHQRLRSDCAGRTSLKFCRALAQILNSAGTLMEQFNQGLPCLLIHARLNNLTEI